ncbi:hypothetical protein V6Z12_A11G195500 [Gossypium hirsutum]
MIMHMHKFRTVSHTEFLSFKNQCLSKTRTHCYPYKKISSTYFLRHGFPHLFRSFTNLQAKKFKETTPKVIYKTYIQYHAQRGTNSLTADTAFTLGFSFLKIPLNSSLAFNKKIKKKLNKECLSDWKNKHNG